jgi:hypothetical protein
MKLFKPLWAYRSFILGSVKREFQSKYRNSLLGAAWTVINPLSENDHSAETRIINGPISWDESAHILIQKSIDIFSTISNARSSTNNPVMDPAARPSQEIPFSKNEIESP